MDTPPNIANGPAPQSAPLKHEAAAARGAKRSRPRRSSPLIESAVISDQTVLAADLRCRGCVQIDGEVRGDVSCGLLVIGGHGRLYGNVAADRAIISGQFEGVIEAARIKLNRDCFVSGTVRAASLEMEAGAYCESKEVMAFTGELKIDGHLKADLSGPRLVISKTARVEADISVDDLIVDGEVHGTIRGRSVMLGPNARVFGSILHSSLSLARGAFFEGKARRSDEPLAAPAD